MSNIAPQYTATPFPNRNYPLRDRMHWICWLLGHKFAPHVTGNWFWCSRCAREELF
jgi:hypothetical protein